MNRQSKPNCQHTRQGVRSSLDQMLAGSMCYDGGRKTSTLYPKALWLYEADERVSKVIYTADALETSRA